MKKSAATIFNAALLIFLAALAYFVMLHFEHRKPQVIVQPNAPIENIAEGQIAPDFSFKALDGETYVLKDFKGKVVILNFWASWCPPCIKEFPHFLRAAKEFENDIIFIGVSSDLDHTSMMKFLDPMKNDIETPNIFITHDEDQSITKSLFQTYRLPETILIDGSQVMRTKLIGADWSYEDLKKHIDLLKSYQ